jgi:hypothetical protein
MVAALVFFVLMLPVTVAAIMLFVLVPLVCRFVRVIV